jgi:gliding motility-associated-like protein
MKGLKTKYLIFLTLLGLSFFSTASWAQAPSVTVNNKKDACRDLVGADGVLDNGSFEVTVTAGIPPLTLFILGPVNYVNVPIALGVPFQVTDLRPGLYTIVVQDGNPVDFTQNNFVINGTTDISVGITPGFPVNSTSCGTPNGQISIDVSGGTSNYSYAWTATNGFTSSAQDITGLTAGDYTVVVSDNGTNCTQTLGPLTVLQPPAPTNAVLSLTGVTPICAGQSSTIKVDVTGGVGPYTLAITGLGIVNNYTDDTDITVSPLANTTYTLTSVTDVNGCPSVAVSGSAAVNVNPVPVAPLVTFTPNTYCVNDAIIAPTITTPIAGSTYTWYSDAGLTSVLITSTTPTNAQLGFSSLVANVTTVFVTETNSSNCEGPATPLTLTVNAIPVAPSVTFSPSTFCVGQAITPPTITTPVGGSTYRWYSDVSLSTLLTTGTTPTNAQLSFSSAAANITTVFVTETNNNNCVGPATSITLTVNAVPLVPGVTFAPSVYCVGSAITPPIITTPTGGSTYTWYSDIGLTTILTTGTNPTNAILGFNSAAANITTVFVTETSSSNCIGPATQVTLTVNANPLAPGVTFSPNTYCVGQAISPPVITVPVGGSTYQWYNDVSLSTLLTTGTAPTNAQLGFSSIAANITTVFVTETNSSNCPGPATSITLTVNAIPIAPSVIFSPSTYCVGASIAPPTINIPTGGSIYTWYSDAGLTTVLTTGAAPTNAQLGFSSTVANITTIFVTETSSSNCTGPATPVTLTVNATPVTPGVTFNPSTYCVGEAIVPPTISAPIGGSTYSWYSDISLSTLLATTTTPSNAQLGFSSVAANTTTVFVTETNSSNCVGPITIVTLTVNAVPVAPAVTFNPNTYCIGAAIIAPAITTPTGGSIYTWYSDSGLTTVLTTGANPTNAQLGFSSAVVTTKTVYVTETNGTNCDGPSTSVTLTVNPVPIAPAVTVSPTTYCVGDPINSPSITTPVGGSVYTWYSNATLTNVLTTGTNPSNAQLGLSSSAPGVTTIFITETNGGCASPATTIAITVNTLPTASISGNTPICNGSSTNLTFTFTGAGPWSFQYSDGTTTFPGNSPISPAIISVSPTSTTTYTIVSVTDLNCTGTIVGSPAVINVVNPNPSLVVTGPVAALCTGGSTSIDIANSEAGASYQLRNDADDSPIGTAVIGTGATISLATGSLGATTSFNILATGGVCTPIELSTIITVNVAGSINLGLSVTAQSTTFCAGNGTIVQIANSEVGVDYQLRNDADNSNVGAIVPGTGGTLDLPTGNLTATTTFNILATNVTCAAELSATMTISVNPAPNAGLSVSALSSTICFGTTTAIQVASSEIGVNYQLRDNVTNNPIGSAVPGTGATLSLPTAVLTVNSTFNVFAVTGPCSAQLTTVVTVNVLASGDPLCIPPNNCATVVITPITMLATCGAAVPDGKVTFDIVPAVPVVNIIGVKIDIDGPIQKTQFNNFVFTALPVGTYDYTVTYGDATNPACIKVGNFTINPTGTPDFVDYSLASGTYDCLVSSGTVSLFNFIGAANTDYTFEVYSNGSVIKSGTITKDQAASGSFIITDLALGQYEIQISQDQSASNGCVGFVTSTFKDTEIIEPTGGCGLFIPNIFTPNGDGANDLLVIRNLPANSQLFITNRWGKEVFSASDYKNDWTGGDIADGVYYYKLSADGQSYNGWIEILR